MLYSYCQCSSDNQQLWAKEARAQRCLSRNYCFLWRELREKAGKKYKWRTTKTLKPSSAHMSPGITCRIYTIISQELIILMDPMGSSKKAHDISDTSLVYFIGFHTLSRKHKERKCISWNIQSSRRVAVTWIIGAVNMYATDPAFCSSRNFENKANLGHLGASLPVHSVKK